MQLIIKNGKVIATHEDHQDIAHLYPDAECIIWGEPIEFGLEELDDPRTEKQKKQSYKDKRRLAYPSIQDQLDMLYHDKINGTSTWVEAITEVKVRYPKWISGTAYQNLEK